MVSCEKLAVLSDFDGTMITVDAPVYLLERYAVGDWRETEHRFTEGLITIEECIRLQLEMIGMGQERMVKELDEVVRPRAGLDALLRHCRSAGHAFEVTSAGLDFYIRHFLNRHGWSGVEIVAPRCEETFRGISVTFPARMFKEAENFKEDRVRHHQGLGRTVAYVGDGTSDLPAAKRADIAFAIRGGSLERLLRDSGKEHHVIDDLSEMLEHLAEPHGVRPGATGGQDDASAPAEVR